jgi:hypothetical protein
LVLPFKENCEGVTKWESIMRPMVDLMGYAPGPGPGVGSHSGGLVPVPNVYSGCFVTNEVLS